MTVSDAATGRGLDLARPRRAGRRDGVPARRAAGRTAGRDGNVKLWEVATGQETCSFDAGSREVTGLGFGADGTQLAALGRDGVIKLWNARPAAMSLDAWNAFRAEMEREQTFRHAAASSGPRWKCVRWP